MNRKQRRATSRAQRSVPSSVPTTPPSSVFQQAVRLHQAGQLSEAARLCRQVLAGDANHADSLYLLGVMANQSGQHDDAANLIGQALVLRSTEPTYHCHLGIALRGQGKPREAMAAYQRALELKPDYVDALHSLAHTLHQEGQLEMAVTTYERVLALRPGHVDAQHQRSNALQQQGKLREAVAGYERTLALKSDHAESHNNLGIALASQGMIERALDCYERAVAIRPGYAEAHFNRGNALRNLGRLSEAVACYRRMLELLPNHPFAYHNMGVALMALDPDEAEKCLRRTLELSPNHASALTNLAEIAKAKGNVVEAMRLCQQSLQLGETEEAKRTFAVCVGSVRVTHDDANLRALLARALEESWGSPEDMAAAAITLVKLNPLTGGPVASVSVDWPYRSALEDSGEAGWLAGVGSDPLLHALLRSTPISDTGLERFLTMARRALLAGIAKGTIAAAGSAALRFHGALASQCFINEYLFSCTETEARVANELKEKLEKVLDSDGEVSPSLILAVACYFPLFKMANADRLLRTGWPSDVEETVRQQVREPFEERQIRATMVRLTDIDDAVSVEVRIQYEENPYPRWINVPSIPIAPQLEGYFRNRFPLAPIRQPENKGRAEILIAGCGTGRQSIIAARRFPAAEVLAIDLSLNSLSYARRKTQELGLTSVTYAQADLLKLGSLGRRFDLIEASGVLHHLADPWQGWRVLVSMLRPGGLMKIGLYSQTARRHIVEIRKVIAQQGYEATPEGMRWCRRDLMNAPGSENLIPLLTGDFFSLSSCRDLLFHVQEHRLTLAQIEAFLQENDLTFLGFDNVHATDLATYRERFPGDPAARHLGHWQSFEADNPMTFLAMYQFLVQKTDGSGLFPLRPRPTYFAPPK